MRSALGPLLLAGLLLGGCEDGKPVTSAPAVENPPAPSAAESPLTPSAAESPPPSEVKRPHGATGVGDTAPVPERAPPKGTAPPNPSEWGKPGLPRPAELERRDLAAGTPSDGGRP
jgi:hypothetical protein